MNGVTLGDALREAARRIGAVDARVLLCHAVGRESAYVAAHTEIELTPADRNRYAGMSPFPLDRHRLTAGKCYFSAVIDH